MHSELNNKMVQLFGSRAGRVAITSDGNWQSVGVQADGSLLISESSTFFPVPASNRRLTVTNVSNRSLTDFVPGKEYVCYSTVDCHIAIGDTTVVATANDPHIPANVMFFFVIVEFTELRLAVLKTAWITPTPADGQLFLFQSSR